ncbi:MAG: hypothetical protein QOG23_3072 [Blastocatellia bacterium]|nr:hypothetical protein [Blastocatellia bacterium]
MSSKWRRFEVLLPLQFNDALCQIVMNPTRLLAAAVLEIVDHFGAVSYETQNVEGQWRHGGVIVRDNLAKIIVDVPDLISNRRWMKQYRDRWRSMFEQVQLWMISYSVDVE